MILLTVVNGQIVGQYRPGAKIVQYFWKNILIGRLKANNPKQQQTIPQATIKAKMTEFTQRFYEILSADDRSKWNVFAALEEQRSPKTDCQSDGARNVIPQHNKTMSGLNSYIASNITSYLIDESSEDFAPLADHIPPPPLDVTAIWTLVVPPEGHIYITWMDPVLQGTYTKKFVRIWIMANTKPKVYRQMVISRTLPSAENYIILNVKRGRYVANINKSGRGIFSIQMDTVTQKESGHGWLISSRSNVSKVDTRFL